MKSSKNLFGIFDIHIDMDWTNPHFLEFFFSARHGLILWHPIFILPLVGYYFLFQKHKQVAIIAILMTAIVFYMHSVPWDWWGGWAFGQRRVADITPILAIGLVALFDKIDKRTITSKITKFVIFVASIYWNLIFLIQWLLMPDKGKEVDFVNGIIPNFANSYSYLHQITRESFSVSSLTHITSELQFEIGLIIRILIVSTPSIVLLVIVFYKEIILLVK